MERRRLATFSLDDLFFGVEVRHVQEVICYQEMTPVPLAPPAIEGLINLRGQIVTAISLRRRLGLPDLDPMRTPMNVVVRREGEVVSLLVDQIGDVLEVDEALFEAPPITVSGAVRDVLRGVYKLNERLLLVLDVERTSDVQTWARSAQDAPELAGG
jgi:purine-binding chemotaxis protein CheW